MAAYEDENLFAYSWYLYHEHGHIREETTMNQKKIIRAVCIVFIYMALIFLEHNISVDISANVKQNQQDIIVIKNIIKKLQTNGAIVKEDINNDNYYKWSDKTGRL